MIRFVSVLVIIGWSYASAQAGEGEPPCVFQGEEVCNILPPSGPPCPAGYFPCCYPCGNGVICETCLPVGADCPTTPQLCPAIEPGGVQCPGVPPNWTCGCLTTLPACWICTTLQSSCQLPLTPKVGSVLTFGMHTIDSCSMDGHAWTICQGANLVQVLDPMDPPNAGAKLRVRAIASGSVTVRAYVPGPGCNGQPYQIAKTVQIAASCIADITGDNTVNVDDLLEVINKWGNPGCGGASCCPSDLDLDGDVDVDDMNTVINNWGPCP